MHPMLNIAIRAVRKAGHLVLKVYEQQECIEADFKKHSPLNVYVERLAEAAMVEIIAKAYPQQEICSVNDIKPSHTKSPVQWVISPIMGSLNFTRQYPHFAVALTVELRSSTEVAVIYDVIRNELFTAVRGRGAQLNGHRIRCSNTKDLRGALLALQLLRQDEVQDATLLHTLQLLLAQHVVIRCSGCSALDLAYISAGRMDGYLHIGKRSINATAAGALLLREAGGLVTILEGRDVKGHTDGVIAGSAQVVRALLLLLCRSGYHGGNKGELLHNTMRAARKKDN